MKPHVRFIVSLMALGGLSCMAMPSHATDIARLPLKASVLAKPNVIFGLDDSGSMDSEVILPNNDGAFWWDYNAGSGWNASGNTWFNAGGDANDRWKKMVYLFPNGNSTGSRVYEDAANDHFAIPPTASLAFTRSPHYNPLYFNPTVIYKPWSPAHVGSAVKSYGNASVTLAKSHPAYGTGTFNVRDTFAATTTTDWTFTALPGMRLPGSATVCDTATCTIWPAVSTLGWTADGSDFVVPAGSKYRVAMDYFPATYYLKETCTYDGSACVRAPDGSTLKRYEIKSSSYATTAAYDAELQNFANWFQYYRKRKLMLNAAMGQVLEPLTGLRLGVVHFNALPGSSTRVTMYDTDATASSENGLKVAGIFYQTDRAGGTPTRETLDRIGEEYMAAGGPIQYACQRNNAFILTDGFANVASLTLPSYSASTWGNGAPYSTTYGNSLADAALAYYTTNLQPSMATGKVPPTPADIDTVPPTPSDTNTNPHMNTFGLSLGAKGVLYNGIASLPPTDPAAWTNPTQNRHPSAVDDLWHATLNGRGQMYLASTPTETAEQIQAGLTAVLNQTGAQGGIAVSTVNLPRGDTKAYFGTYNPSGWAGDLTANKINAETGSVDTTASWKAGALLQARTWTTRIIATSSGIAPNSAAVPFDVTNAASTVNPASAYGGDAAVIDYLRGDTSGEGTLFRKRTSLMGAIINSEPAMSREDSVVYVASGEGMLHAFDTSAANPGKELWAFVPRQVLPSIGETVERGYVFRTKLDGTPVLGKYSATGKILVAGMGVAGRGYFALDVSNPRVSAANQLVVKWQFPAATDVDKVGQTLGRPVIVKSENNGYVVLLTSGYNNAADGPGRLWMLNADTGAVLKVFTTTASSTDSGLAHVAAFAEPPTGTVRYAYGGDLLGNVWRFDLSDPSATPTPKLLATLTGPGTPGAAQPITAAPELLWHKETGQRVVMIGTGRLLDIGDFLNTNVQSIYAIADDATLLPLSTPRTTLAKQTYVRGATPDLDTLTGPSVNWTTNRGWFIDLPAKEQINTRPTIAYGGLAFVSNSNGGSSCEANSYLYVVDVLSGKKFAGTDFIGTLLSDKSNSSGVTALLTRGQKIVGAGQDGDGKPWSRDITAGSPIKPSKNSWFEVRR